MPICRSALVTPGRLPLSRRSHISGPADIRERGCTLSLHVQDDRIAKVTSPVDVEVTHGHLCIKGRFGFAFVHGGEPDADPPEATGPDDR